MNRKNIIIIIILALLVALPWWRINHNSQFFVEGVFSQLSHLGDWNYADYSASISGDIAIQKVQFKPRGYRQVIQIDSITLTTDARNLLFTPSTDLLVKLPEKLTINFNQAHIVDRDSALQRSIYDNNYYPMVVGYLGAFACGQNSGPSFSEQQWQKILPQSPQFDVKLTYALVDEYALDFNININNTNNWYSTWSGSLARTDNDDRLSFHDTIIDTLYYYYSDQGFNTKRNDLCGGKPQSSFATYRANSADALQQNLRVYAGGEMSQKVSNLYQRSLQPDIEFNLIFKLNEPMYMFEFSEWSQHQLFAHSDIEAAIGEQDYQDIKLSKIDHLNLDMDTLRNDMEQREQVLKEQEETENKPKELIKQVTTHIGGQQRSEQTINNWADALGQEVRVKTKRGRPIFGVLKAINDQQVTVSTRFKTGDATISIQRKDVLSVSINR